MKNDFAFSLFDLDWDVFSVHIEGACNRVPVIAETGIKSTVCGPGEVNLSCSQPVWKKLLQKSSIRRSSFHYIAK